MPETHFLTVNRTHLLTICRIPLLTVCETHILTIFKTCFLSICKAQLLTICKTHLTTKLKIRLWASITQMAVQMKYVQFVSCESSCAWPGYCWTSIELGINIACNRNQTYIVLFSVTMDRVYRLISTRFAIFFYSVGIMRVG